MTSEEKESVDLILRFGMIDGAHHKQWILDQVLHLLLDPDGAYEDTMKEYNSDPEYEPWDTGIAP